RRCEAKGIATRCGGDDRARARIDTRFSRIVVEPEASGGQLAVQVLSNEIAETHARGRKGVGSGSGGDFKDSRPTSDAFFDCQGDGAHSQNEPRAPSPVR